jgi:branched-chain amino acid transport system permease protein
LHGRKGGLVRDSIADIESFRPASPGWPASIGMGGRLPSESMAGLHRNQWPLCVGLRTMLSGFIIWGPVLVTKYRLFVLVLTAAILFALWLFLQRTRYGRIIRAGSRDAEMVSMLGINLPRVFTFVFGLGTALAGAAGVLAAPLWSVVPSMAEGAIMPAFVVVTIGGLGSFGGAVVSGLLVGVSVALTIQFWPAASSAVMYALMVLVLLLRPRGLLGESWERFE